MVKSGILKLNTRDKDRNCMPLAMKVIVKPIAGSHLFSTTQAAEKGAFTHSEAENHLIAKEKEIRLVKSPDRYKVYLDENIARRPTDVL